MSTRAHLKVGTLIVLEGLDKTGKTTQAEILKQRLDPSTTEHVHMPQGFSPFTSELYRILEEPRTRPSPGVGRQLAHLACHAESIRHIDDLLRERAVLLDRWWWSTVAYGWYSGEVPNGGVSEEVFMGLIDSIWGSLTASVVFLFDEPHEQDSNNLAAVRDGYQKLADAHADVTVHVPIDQPEQVTTFILDELARRRLLTYAD